MKAICFIDLQNDFIDGSMGVGSEKFAKAWDNTLKLIEHEKFEVFLATMDFHPKNHCSFKENGGEWPTHCVQGTGGVRLNWRVLEFLDQFNITHLERGEEYPLMLLKGQKANTDEYSVDLLDFDRYVSYLARTSMRDITELHIVGLCTDYAVKNCAVETARMHRDLPIYIHTDCCVAVDPGKKLDLYEYQNIHVVGAGASYDAAKPNPTKKTTVYENDYYTLEKEEPVNGIHMNPMDYLR